MRRREFVTGLGCAAAAWTGCALAQTDKINRLAVLGASSRGLDFVRAVTLPELQKLGYAEGQNLVVDMRSGPPAELPELARLLVASKPSAIFRALWNVSRDITKGDHDNSHCYVWC